MEEKKEELSKGLKTQEEIKRDKRIRRNCGCCGTFIFLLLTIGAIMIYGLFNGVKDITVNVPTPTETAKPAPVSDSKTSTKENQNQSANEVQSCQQVSTPGAASMNLSTTNPGYKEDIDYINFPVYGYTPNDLHNQVNACGPKVNGEAFGGITSWNINWQVDYDVKATTCGLKNETVGIKIDIIIPKWQESDGVTAAAISYWQEYINRLTNHENAHKDMDIAAAQNLYNQLISLSDATTCDEAYGNANALASQVLSDLNAENENFDNSTNHGSN